jgi:CheY-like chemotaxis protein
MPQVDGFEFLLRFRERAASRKTPVIVWTGKDISNDERDRLKRLAQAVTLKSTDGFDAVVRELQRHSSQCSPQRLSIHWNP